MITRTPTLSCSLFCSPLIILIIFIIRLLAVMCKEQQRVSNYRRQEFPIVLFVETVNNNSQLEPTSESATSANTAVNLHGSVV